jgi:hypothetical protein
MLTDLYVREKLWELEADRRAQPRLPSTPAPVLSPIVRAAGRALRRMGEGLESWASPPIPGSDGAQAMGSAFRPREEGC